MAKPDVIVVGAGIVGCSIAFHLARRRVKVAVFDKTGVAGGMTSRSGALLRMHYSFAPEAALAWKSLEYFQNWRERIGGDCGFVKTGFVIVVNADNADRLRANVAMLKNVGVDTDLINAPELGRLEPEFNLDDVALAAYEPNSGYADPLMATLSLAEAARKLGAEFILDQKASALELRGRRLLGIRDSKSSLVEAGAVCIASGPWTDSLLSPLGLAIGLRAQRAQIAFFDRSPSRRHCACIDTIAGSYFRPHADNLILAGLGDWKNEPASCPDRFKETNDSDFIDAVRQRLGRRIPRLARAPYRRGHAGIYDVSPDSRAVLAPLPGIGGLFVAAGFSGTGFKTAPAVGAAMAELITDGRGRTVDISAFGFERLRSGNLIRPANEYIMPPGFGHSL